MIDAHNHLGRWLSPERGWVPADLAGGPRGLPWTVADVEALLALLDRHDVELVVNLDGRWDAELEANLERYDRAVPGRFLTFCQLDWSRAAAGDSFGDELAESLERSIRTGARGLKVWKTLGLGWRDAAGEMLLPDDRRIAPVWEQAAALGIPVLIHTADPPAFFEPQDEHSSLPPAYHGHPDCSFHGGDFPSHARLLEAFEAMVAAHPQTTFIGAHLVTAEDLSWIRRLLERYSNLFVDFSGRHSELSQAPEASRELLMRHSDRVLFGSDAFPPSGEIYSMWFAFLEDELGLPDDVLGAIYRDNALRLLPQR